MFSAVLQFTKTTSLKIQRLSTQTLSRNPNFNTLNASDLKYFLTVLPKPSSVLYSGDLSYSSVKKTEDDLQIYNVDWMKKYKGRSSLVLRPTSTKEVSQVLKHCNNRKLAVVPQGGNTGLVGGSVPVFDEIILNLDLMHTIRSFDQVSGVITCESGCILESVDHHLSTFGHMMPLDLGAKGSCQLGGNLATNAGGLRVLRYGSLRGSVLGLEVVLANGDILDTLVPLRKDNTGLDLKQLFVGSEGTLGVITAVSMLAPVRPNDTQVAVLMVPNYESVQRTFLSARTILGETLSAFEFWDSDANKLVEKYLPDIQHPLTAPEQDGVFYVLIETAGSDAKHNVQKLETYLEHVMDDTAKPLVIDGTLAQDGKQAATIWSIREGIPEACSKAGAVYKYDVSVPVPALYDLVHATRKQVKHLHSVTNVIGYGHLGDGNLHLNVSAKGYSDEVENALEPFVYEWVAKHRGSISAEHGLGLMKPKYLHYSKTPLAISLMHQIKTMLDPNGIMNPYKFLPPLKSE